MSAESFGKFMDDINTKVTELVSSSKGATEEKLGGITALGMYSASTPYMVY